MEPLYTAKVGQSMAAGFVTDSVLSIQGQYGSSRPTGHTHKLCKYLVLNKLFSFRLWFIHRIFEQHLVRLELERTPSIRKALKEYLTQKAKIEMQLMIAKH